MAERGGVASIVMSAETRSVAALFEALAWSAPEAARLIPQLDALALRREAFADAHDGAPDPLRLALSDLAFSFGGSHLLSPTPGHRTAVLRARRVVRHGPSARVAPALAVLVAEVAHAYAARRPDAALAVTARAQAALDQHPILRAHPSGPLRVNAYRAHAHLLRTPLGQTTPPDAVAQHLAEATARGVPRSDDYAVLEQIEASVDLMCGDRRGAIARLRAWSSSAVVQLEPLRRAAIAEQRARYHLLDADPAAARRAVRAADRDARADRVHLPDFVDALRHHRLCAHLMTYTAVAAGPDRPPDAPARDPVLEDTWDGDPRDGDPRLHHAHVLRLMAPFLRDRAWRTQCLARAVDLFVDLGCPLDALAAYRALGRRPPIGDPIAVTLNGLARRALGSDAASPAARDGGRLLPFARPAPEEG
ncbi:MAG: hypothetical protein AAF772_08345 [Acidobacteriota bacterium]